MACAVEPHRGARLGKVAHAECFAGASPFAPNSRAARGVRYHTTRGTTAGPNHYDACEGCPPAPVRARIAMEARHPATRSNREAFTRDENLILLKGPNRWISNWRKSRSSGIRDHEISRFLNNLSTALVRSFFHNPIRFGI